MSYNRLLGLWRSHYNLRHMNIFSLRRFCLKSVLVMSLSLPFLAGAQQYFTDSGYGDLDAGFRKTGSHQESGEIVAYLGNVSNLLALTAGTTINMTNFNTVVLTNMCPDGFNYLQWSVFATFTGPNSWTNALGVFPGATCWYTVPRTNVNDQTKPVNRFTPGSEPTLESAMLGVPYGAYNIGSGDLITSNVDNSPVAVLEPIADGPEYLLDQYIGANGNFGGSVLTFSVENNTSNSFTAPVISDFYQNVPASTKTSGFNIDPITGLTNGPAYYVGYFTLNPSGSLTFTRAISAPTVSSVTASATNGFGPLTVVFSDTTSGSATSWVWNFGNGISVTNTTSGNVTNTYANAGSYTVTLTVYGPGGSTVHTVANFIVASPRPQILLTASSGQVVFSGTNCPVGVQYRILTSTNVTTALANWKPIFTNTFSSNGSFSYTNTVGGANSFFIMASP